MDLPNGQEHIGEDAMSEIESGGPRLGAGQVTNGLLLYGVSTDYGNQLMTFTVPGNWEVALDGASTITASANYDASNNATAIDFCFKLALPGASVGATLTSLDDNTTTIPLTLTVPD